MDRQYLSVPTHSRRVSHTSSPNAPIQYADRTVSGARAAPVRAAQHRVSASPRLAYAPASTAAPRYEPAPLRVAQPLPPSVSFSPLPVPQPSLAPFSLSPVPLAQSLPPSISVAPLPVPSLPPAASITSLYSATTTPSTHYRSHLPTPPSPAGKGVVVSHTVTTPGVVPVGLVSTYDLAQAAFERADHPEAEVYHEEHAYAPEAEGVTEPYHYGEDSHHNGYYQESPAVGSPLEAPRGPYGWDQDGASDTNPGSRIRLPYSDGVSPFRFVAGVRTVNALQGVGAHDSAGWSQASEPEYDPRAALLTHEPPAHARRPSSTPSLTLIPLRAFAPTLPPAPAPPRRPSITPVAAPYSAPRRPTLDLGPTPPPVLPREPSELSIPAAAPQPGSVTHHHHRRTSVTIVTHTPSIIGLPSVVPPVSPQAAPTSPVYRPESPASVPSPPSPAYVPPAPVSPTSLPRQGFSDSLPRQTPSPPPVRAPSPVPERAPSPVPVVRAPSPALVVRAPSPPPVVRAPSPPPAPKPAPKPAAAAKPAAALGPDGQPVSPRTHMAIMAFQRFDTDHSGNLDVQEFHKAMQSLGLGYSFEDAENLFMMMDEDGNGEMDMQEFLTHCREYITNSAQAVEEDMGDVPMEERAVTVFRRYDNYGQGYLELQDFLAAVRDLGLGTSEEDAKSVFAMMDSDGSGTLIEAEFVRYCVTIADGGVFTVTKEAADPIVRQAGPLVFTGNPLADAKMCFRRFDDDGSGFLDIYEFMRAMKEMGLGMTFQEAQTLFSQIDTDGSGTMDEEEFTTHYINHIVAQRKALTG
eukprot:EG_transcript_2500